MSETVIYWLPCASVLLHIGEEFVWPGGFAAWFKAYRPETGLSFTAAYAVIVNGTLIAVAASLGAFGQHWSRGASVWLVLSAVLAYNALFHLVGAVRTLRYSPGMVTGLLLYVPLSMVGTVYFYITGEATPTMIVSAFGLGSLFQVWSYFNHQQRAAARGQRMA